MVLYWAPTRGADFHPGAHRDAPKHKGIPKRCTQPPKLLFECDLASKLAGRKEDEYALCGKKKGLIPLKATASMQRKTKRKKSSQLTFLISTVPLLLKCWCWLGTPAVEKYTGSVTSLSPLLEHQYRAAYGERKTSIKKTQWHGNSWWSVISSAFRTRQALRILPQSFWTSTSK